MLSALVITKNEENNIERCLKSLQFVDEIILVDAESHDRTVEIAKSLNAKTFVRPWPGYGPQRNFAARQATGEWLLVVDADEEITPELAEEIKRTLNSPTKDFYWVKITTVFLNRPMQYIFGYNLRLFKKSAGHWTDAKVHEQLQTGAGQGLKLGDDISALISTPLLHHSHQTVKSYLSKMHRYTTLDAEQIARTNRHRSGKPARPTWWLPIFLAKKQFLKLYFYRRGFLDGYAGFMWSLLSGYYEWEMGQKFLALTRNSNVKRKT